MKKPFEICLQLAKKASLNGEVPIGAVVVRDGRVLAKAFNETEVRGEFAAHAEMIALRKASKKLGSKYLIDCELYVSLEPCSMCRAAAQLSRVKAVHWLLDSEKFGAAGKALWKTKFQSSAETTDFQQERGEAKKILQDFFAPRRKKKS